MGIGPYITRPYQRDTGRISQLMLRRGQVVADGERERGAIWGGAAQQIGQIAAQTMGDLGRWKAGEPERKYREAKMAAEQQGMRRADELQETFKEIGTMPVDEGIKVLRERGFAKEAEDLLDKVAQRRSNLLRDQAAAYDLVGKQLDAAGGLIGTVLDAPPEARPSAYEAVRDNVRKIVGPELATQLPDTYDEAIVTAAAQWGMSQRDKIASRGEIAKQAAEIAKNVREGHEFGVAVMSQWATTVDSQADWDEMLAGAKAFGVPAETLASIGSEFTPDAVKRLQALATKPATAPQAGSFGAYLDQLKTERGGKPLTAAEQRAARRTWESAGWKPESGDRAPSSAAGSKPLSNESRAVAARWKADALASLEDERRERMNTRSPMSDQELETRKAEILKAFDEQLGVRPAPPPGPGAGMGSLGRPSSSPRGPQIEFRAPGSGPLSSAKPEPIRRLVPDEAGQMHVMEFPSEEQYRTFLRLTGYTEQ